MKEVSAIIGYIFMVIFTFGHAYANYPDTEKGYFGGTEFTIRNGPGTKGSGALISSIAWPMYWSVKLQEKEKQ